MMHNSLPPVVCNNISTTPNKSAPTTFESVFFHNGHPPRLRIPDYQRAYAWDLKQVDLFISDLVKYVNGSTTYYLGHFIVEESDAGWDIVDGQQRITTIALFLMVCRMLRQSDADCDAITLIDNFTTVSYDQAVLKLLSEQLPAYLAQLGPLNDKRPPSDDQLKAGFTLESHPTRSQRKLALALLRFHQAFHTGELDRDLINGYLHVVMQSSCSLHVTYDKSVAVSIFEMHNTRGVPLTALEIIKAMLMKYVYDHGGTSRDAKVKTIQDEFASIYKMEEQLAQTSFRGKMTMEQLLRLHLRVVDDGCKTDEKEYHYPASNASNDDLIKYVEQKLQEPVEKHPSETRAAPGINYALNLARELNHSVRIMSHFIPGWDREEPLVGDVLILDRDLSTEFFLLICRMPSRKADTPYGKVDHDTLLAWERLLFTRNFHDKYHRLNYRDNFQKLFSELNTESSSPVDVIMPYVINGFRSWDLTRDLQGIVSSYLNVHRDNILNKAFYWWKDKMIYALYKYETSLGANVRETMKGTVSVEHILPQDWQWEWIAGYDKTKAFTETEQEAYLKEIGHFINGIGNLLILTPGENTSAGNQHPADKTYADRYKGGTYDHHRKNREQWRLSTGWKNLIKNRGEAILDFMQKNLVGIPQFPQTTSISNESNTHD